MSQQWERRDFLKSVTYGAAALRFPQKFAPAQPSGGKPNIVVILADDMGYGDVSCQSIDTKIHTPHMDRLSAEGMRFTDAHSSSAVCTPSRYALLTGRYCWRSRLKRSVMSGFDAPLIAPHRMTVASLLKKHGYTTACLGKWHLGFGWRTRDGEVSPWKDGKRVDDAAKVVDYDQPLAVSPLDHGFDYFYGFSAALDMPPYCYLENDRLVQAPTEYTHGSNVATEGYWRPGPIAPGFKHVEVLPNLTRRAVKYIDEHASKSAETPFFLYFPINAPHRPVAPAPFVKGSSQAGDYGDFIVEIDWSVGQVMEALERNGIADRTMVILTSDNGSPARTDQDDTPYSLVRLYQHYPNGNLRGIKADIWDGGHREPFIVRWPGKVTPGTTNAETICLADLMATLAAIVGESLPEDAGEDSYNILPSLLMGQRAGGGIRPTTIHHSVNGMYAIRSGPWKLIQGVGSGGWDPCAYVARPDEPEGQLYNMDVDVEEKENVYDQHPDIVRNLTSLLQEIRLQGHS
jgi:arylsulfatase A-like enzyme